MQYLILLLTSIMCLHTTGVLEAKTTTKQAHVKHTKIQPQKTPSKNSSRVAITTVLYVDNNCPSDTEETGSENAPFRSIQKALRTIARAEELPSGNLNYTLFISSGIYNEDIVINETKQKITLVALGPVQIGKKETPKKLIWKGSNNPYDQIKYNLRLTTLLPQISAVDEPNGFLITGDIQLIHSNKQPCSLILDEVTVLGNIQATEATANIYASNTHISGDFIGGTSTELTQAIQTVFDGKVAVRSYGQIMMCHIKKGMQVYAVYPRTRKLPEGMLLSRLEGPFEGPARSFRLDTYTNDSFIRKNAELRNEATKELLFSPIP